MTQCWRGVGPPLLIGQAGNGPAFSRKNMTVGSRVSNHCCRCSECAVRTQVQCAPHNRRAPHNLPQRALRRRRRRRSQAQFQAPTRSHQTGHLPFKRIHLTTLYHPCRHTPHLQDGLAYLPVQTLHRQPP
jgi:hypothetical protein